jgi:hypothetical protein
MADFTLQIQEKITLGNTVRDSLVTQTISNANYVDNRILTIPSGSITTIFSFSPTSSAGTFLTSSFQYGRVTNKSTTIPIKLIVSSSVESMSYLINAGSTFMLSTTSITGSINGLLFNNIASVKLEPSGSAADIEYFIIGT